MLTPHHFDVTQLYKTSKTILFKLKSSKVEQKKGSTDNLFYLRMQLLNYVIQWCIACTLWMKLGAMFYVAPFFTYYT